MAISEEYFNNIIIKIESFNDLDFVNDLFSKLQELCAKLQSIVDTASAAYLALKAEFEKKILEFQKLIQEQIDALNAYKEEIDKFMQDVLDSVAEQLALIQPLLSIPTDLGEVIDWIKSMVDLFTSQYDNLILAQVKYALKLVEMTTKTLSTLANLADKLNYTCSF